MSHRAVITAAVSLILVASCNPRGYVTDLDLRLTYAPHLFLESVPVKLP